MNRTTFNKSVVPGLFSMMVEAYKPKSGEQLWKQLYKVKQSKRAYEESAYLAPFSLIPLKPEGKQIQYDEMVQGPTKRWSHRTFGLGTKITEELIEDALYPEVPTEFEQISRELGASSYETLEVLGHDIINSGTSTTAANLDGFSDAIFNTNKKRLRGGTWNNLLSPAADLSATSLQAALDLFENTKDDTGKIQIIRAKEIWVAPANAWKTKELLNSAYDPESANNSINAIKERNLQIMVSPFLTNNKAFTLLAEPPHENGGFIAFMRRKVTFAQDGDFESGDAKFKVTFRVSFGCNKPNHAFHSAGT
jgi:hypothetical protein